MPIMGKWLGHLDSGSIRKVVLFSMQEALKTPEQ